MTPRKRLFRFEDATAMQARSSALHTTAGDLMDEAHQAFDERKDDLANSLRKLHDNLIAASDKLRKEAEERHEKSASEDRESIIEDLEKAIRLRESVATQMKALKDQVKDLRKDLPREHEEKATAIISNINQFRSAEL